MVIKRFDPLSCGKVAGIGYAIMGLFVAAIVSPIVMFGGLGASVPRSGPMGLLLGAGAIVVLPIFYGLLGFVMSMVGAALYNGIARVTGGVRIDLE